MMKATILILVGGGVLCAEPPQDQQGAPSVPPVLKILDENGDGALSASEIANASEALAVLDIDRNGRLSEEEMRPKPPEGEEGERRRPRREREAEEQELMAHPVMTVLDQNTNGTLSKRELARATKSLLELDVDESGALEVEEMMPEEESDGKVIQGGGWLLRPQEPLNSPRQGRR